MKKILTLLLLACMLLSSCSKTNTAETTNNGTTVNEDISASDDANDGNSSGDRTVEAGAVLSDTEIYGIFSELNEQAVPIIFWYMEDPAVIEDLDISESSDHAPYYKVGKFSSINEMKAATDAVFTNAFADQYFYDHAFVESSGNDPMYKEIDGELYRNADMGGMGWPYKATDEYYVPYQDKEMIVISVRCLLPGDEITWENFLLRNDNNVWKLDTYIQYNPYMEFADAFPAQRFSLMKSAVSSWFGAQDWTDANQLDANSLINFYLYTYLSDVTEEYDYEKGYEVSSKDLIDGLSVYLKDIKLETLIAVNESAGANARYDEGTDSFYFEISFDPADYIVVNSETRESIITLEIMVIGKSGKAAYTSYLDLEIAGEDIKLVGNKFGGYMENE